MLLDHTEKDTTESCGCHQSIRTMDGKQISVSCSDNQCSCRQAKRRCSDKCVCDSLGCCNIDNLTSTELKKLDSNAQKRWKATCTNNWLQKLNNMDSESSKYEKAIRNKLTLLVMQDSTGKRHSHDLLNFWKDILRPIFKNQTLRNSQVFVDDDDDVEMIDDEHSNISETLIPELLSKDLEQTGKLPVGIYLRFDDKGNEVLTGKMVDSIFIDAQAKVKGHKTRIQGGIVKSQPLVVNLIGPNNVLCWEGIMESEIQIHGSKVHIPLDPFKMALITNNQQFWNGGELNTVTTQKEQVKYVGIEFNSHLARCISTRPLRFHREFRLKGISKLQIGGSKLQWKPTPGCGKNKLKLLMPIMPLSNNNKKRGKARSDWRNMKIGDAENDNDWWEHIHSDEARVQFTQSKKKSSSDCGKKCQPLEARKYYLNADRKAKLKDNLDVQSALHSLQLSIEDSLKNNTEEKSQKLHLKHIRGVMKSLKRQQI